MVKYCGHYITVQEVPNEISLVLSIANCPHRCEGCHSPWLQKDFGDELTPDVLSDLIKKYPDSDRLTWNRDTDNFSALKQPISDLLLR